MFTFIIDYFLLVFVAAIGTLQISASIGRLNGLLFFKSPIIARTLGAALVVAAFVWFFSTAERNVNDFEGGADANDQGLFFFLGVLAAGGFTFIASSIVNRRMNGAPPTHDGGLDALRDMTYARALGFSIIYWRKQWRQMKNYFSG